MSNRERDVDALAEKLLAVLLGASDVLSGPQARGDLEDYAKLLAGRAFMIAEVFIEERGRRIRAAQAGLEGYDDGAT